MSVLALLTLLPLLVTGVFAVILVVVLTRSRSRPAAPVLAPAPGGGFAPVPSTWNAQVLGSGVIGAMGGALGSTYGTLALDAGWLAFTPDGAAEPQWRVSCRELWVRRQGVGPFTVASVRLHGPMGEVACNVSREHINRWSANTLKDFRQSGYAAQFLAAVQAHGARVG
ncbi:hypothetical protein [Nocardioides sp. cx-173]|uniref:hypothetical protein n=1 Tax=Nocardioides sp. cx-173 TaxID=2898796 RepID=UPI001E60670F|nr:hypothetical protein [Nocardioides sp. cx-173]MCD4526996.1 hypothetical protein [Nocardioides sp. cx-173]UGB41069.1 hypothetical protein LQ940_17070 [Nocardioides sp. cx-173]